MAYQIKNIKDEILLITDIVPESFQEAIVNRVQGVNHFPWFLLHRIGHPDYFGSGVSSHYTDPNITDDVGFFHMAFDGDTASPHYDFFKTILEFFVEKTNIKIKNLYDVEYHIFALEWTPTYLKFYCDGKVVKEITDPKAIPQVAHYIYFSGSCFGKNDWLQGDVRMNEFIQKGGVAEAYIDYVRVFQTKN